MDRRSKEKILSTSYVFLFLKCQSEWNVNFRTSAHVHSDSSVLNRTLIEKRKEKWGTFGSKSAFVILFLLPLPRY